MGIDRWIDGWMHRNRQILIFLHPIASHTARLVVGRHPVTSSGLPESWAVWVAGSALTKSD